MLILIISCILYAWLVMYCHAFIGKLRSSGPNKGSACCYICSWFCYCVGSSKCSSKTQLCEIWGSKMCHLLSRMLQSWTWVPLWPVRIIAMLEKNGIMKIANVGDCGLRVIRKGTSLSIVLLPISNITRILQPYVFVFSPFIQVILWLLMQIGQVVFSTSPQEHYFDCPYQLSSEASGQTYLDATVWRSMHPEIFRRLTMILSWFSNLLMFCKFILI